MTCGRFSVEKDGVLRAIDDGAREIARKVGEQLTVEVMYDRDMIYHRRVFATIGDLALAVGQSAEWMRAQLLVYTGLCHVVGALDDSRVVAVNSMSRHSMRDEELHHFWEDAKQHVVDRVLPTIRNETVRDRLHTAVTAF
jgi:hypothetical protein